MQSIQERQPTPAERGKKRRENKLRALERRKIKLEQHEENVAIVFLDLKHLIASHLGFFWQIQFNKISKRSYINLISKEYTSVFKILNGLYRCMCMEVKPCYNPITRKHYNGIVNPEYNQRYCIIVEISNDCTEYEKIRRAQPENNK